MKRLKIIALIMLYMSCNKATFELKENNKVGIDFNNKLTFSNDFNVYKYRNFYNGGGVAIGDINNDDFKIFIYI